MTNSRALARWTVWDTYRFSRFSALSFSLIVPLLGAATAAQELAAAVILALIVVAASVHVFAFVLNDVIDLPIDRSEPLRADSPLVRGLIRPADAAAIALFQVPLSLAIHLWLKGGAVAAVLLAAAFLLGGVYNVYGKRLAIPIITDAVQALAWVALAFYGAFVARGNPSKLTFLLAALVFVYVLMINGVHGGLRDLANDLRCGARTTAIYFGAQAGPGGEVVVPRRLVLYAVMLQGSSVGLTLVCLVLNWPGYGRLEWHATLWMMLAVNGVLIALMRQAQRSSTSRPELIRAGMLHLFLSMGLLLVPFAFYFDALTTGVVLVCYAAPVAVMWLHDGLRWG